MAAVVESEENEIPANFFKGVELIRPTPKIYLVGETYIFQGKIIDFHETKEVVIQINPPGGQIFEFYCKTEDGSFAPDLKKKSGIASGKKEDMFEFLEEIGQGDVIKREVHFQTLNKLYRDGALDSAPTDLLSTWEEKQIKMRRATGTLP